jgi:hypothetical protein
MAPPELGARNILRASYSKWRSALACCRCLAAPRWPFATLAARSTLAIPTCPRGRRGQGTMLNHRVGQLTTQPVQQEKAAEHPDNGVGFAGD